MALHLCEQGKLKEGLFDLEVLHKKYKKHPAILAPMGTIALQMGDVSKGIECLKISLDQDPHQLSALNNLGNALIEIKKPHEALPFFDRALQININFLEPYYNKARAYSALGQYNEAIKLYEELIQKEPHYLWAYINQGYCYYQLEDYTKALTLYDEALKIHSNIFELHYNRGLTQAKLNRPIEAVDSFNLAIQINPKNKDVYIELAQCLEKIGEMNQAKQGYLEALKLDPYNLEIYSRLLKIYPKLDDSEVSDIYINEALKIDPTFEDAFMAQAGLYLRQGHFEKAQSIYQDLINKNASCVAECFVGIIRTKKIKDVNDNMMHEIQSLITISNNKDKIKLYYALGKAYQDLKLYDESFEYFRLANTLSATEYVYDVNAQSRGVNLFRDLIDFFDGNLIKKIGAYASDSDLPIIIVGMPRSGTTLTETIISSHPNVAPAGEVSYWKQPSIEEIKNTTAEEWTKYTFNYIERLKKISNSNDSILRITDKMPHNFVNLGIIASLYPKAKLVHCKRDPLDNCWSIYNQNFNQFHGYKYDLEGLGKYYLAYDELMRHWEKLFENRILTLKYEDLVENPEYWSRKLIEHVGLPWDDACLSHHKKERTVKTASIWQVRQPIYKTSVKRAEQFSKHLKPLRDILEGGQIEVD
jgi:tetratricopeptide (TPR) repeat protein